MYSRGTKVCSYHLDFHYKNLSYAFLLSKNGLCLWISAKPFVQNDIFLKVLYISWVWDFGDMYLIHLGIRI
jgi:hypothetical protein